MANTKALAKEERKAKKRAARKKAPPKPKRPQDVPRGSRKRKMKKMVRGQSKR